jgi:nucleoside-diphosphate-sugar epimerase
MKRVLVTGGRGFIGRHITEPLRRLGFEVHTVDICENPDPHVQHHVGDLHNIDQVRAIVNRVAASHLLHFAWYVKHGEFWTSPENIRWVQSSVDLLLAFIQAGGKRAVSAGTCAEYEPGHDLCRENETPCRPVTLYGSCKLAFSVLQDGICRQRNVSCAWGRVFHLYGPFEPERRFVPAVIRSLLAGEPARCTHGRQVRDFMHVSDVARAFAHLLDSDVEGPVNVASGSPVTQAEVARLIGNEIGRADLLRLGDIPAGNEPDRLVADISRLKQTGFDPNVNVQTGISDYVRWWRERLSAITDQPATNENR